MHGFLVACVVFVSISINFLVEASECVNPDFCMVVQPPNKPHQCDSNPNDPDNGLVYLLGCLKCLPGFHIAEPSRAEIPGPCFPDQPNYHLHWPLNVNGDCQRLGAHDQRVGCDLTLSDNGAEFYNNALLLDGFAGSAVAYANIFQWPSFSVTLYANYEYAASASPSMLSTASAIDSLSSGWAIRCLDNEVWGVEWSDGSRWHTLRSAERCVENQWTYLAFTYDDASHTGVLYVHGVFAGAIVASMFRDSTRAEIHGKSLYFGGANRNWNRDVWKGSLATVAFYSYVLDDAGVAHDPHRLASPLGASTPRTSKVGAVVLGVLGTSGSICGLVLIVVLCWRCHQRRKRIAEHRDASGFAVLSPVSGARSDEEGSLSEGLREGSGSVALTMAMPPPVRARAVSEEELDAHGRPRALSQDGFACSECK